MKVRLGGLQFKWRGSREKTLKVAEGLLHEAAAGGVRICTTQEMSVFPWFPQGMDSAGFRLAEPIDGPTVSRFRDLAARYSMVIVFPFFERLLDGLYSNSAAVIDADGSLLGVYRKNHIPMTPKYCEKFYFHPSEDGFPVFQTSFGTIGIQICWDNFFPEGSRILSLKGAQIILAPTAADSMNAHEKWFKALSTNAIINCVFVMRVNRVGHDGPMRFYGKSFCVDPAGELIAGPATNKDAVLIADADLDRIGKERADWPFLRDRRPEIYKELTLL